MEVARNPSDENIRLWLSYIDKKNYLADRLRTRIAEFSSKSQGANTSVLAAQTIRQIPVKDESFDPSRFRIRTYFESTCPHCKHMLQTLRSLQDQGVYVEALQIDRAQTNAAMFPIATLRADPEDVKKQSIESVPFTLVADTKSKTVLKPITGFKSLGEMNEILRQMARAKN